VLLHLDLLLLLSRTYEFLDTHLQKKREMYEVGERVSNLQVYSFMKCINSFNLSY